MALPFFYIGNAGTTGSSLELIEETSRHIAQVLRMQNGDPLQLTNGEGVLYTATITDNNKKKCVIKITDHVSVPGPQKRITVAISPIKNNNRFEWFLEKAAELGVAVIIPVLCTRTERWHFREERLKNILVSAMLQSQQCWLPHLAIPVEFKDLVLSSMNAEKFIAHCEKEDKIKLRARNPALKEKLILIGPEGDFTKDEIRLALAHDFIPVSLGNTRLRTETAGIVAATLLLIDSIPS
jgi:16S rRNA (uracil1498-N3)-methyltransferase